MPQAAQQRALPQRLLELENLTVLENLEPATPRPPAIKLGWLLAVQTEARLKSCPYPWQRERIRQTSSSFQR